MQYTTKKHTKYIEITRDNFMHNHYRYRMLSWSVIYLNLCLRVVHYLR